jgi:signal transduction histidine kinase
MTNGPVPVKKPRFVGRAVPLVLAAFVLGFVGVLGVDLFIEHLQIEGSTHAAVSAVSTLNEVREFQAALERYGTAEAYKTPDQQSDRNALLSARSRLGSAMQEFERRVDASDLPAWRSTRDRIAAFDGRATLEPGVPAATTENRVHALEPDLSTAANIVTRSGLAELRTAEQLHTLHGTLEACVLFLIAGVVVARLLAWRQQEARAHARDAQVEDHLRRALVDLDQFAGRLVHDLRNPLTPILSDSRWIEKAPVSDAVRVHAERIERSARRASRMIDALLQYTLASATGEVERARTPVNATVEEVLEDFVQAAGTRGAHIVTSLGPDVAVACPSEVLRSLVANLVDNALKYGAKKGATPRVTVRTRVEESSGVIEVEDAGPGIPPELRKQVFQPLFRAQEGGEGIGLGLSIVQRLVEKQRGRVELCTGEQGGSLFRVVLPIEPAVSASQPTRTGEGHPARPHDMR